MNKLQLIVTWAMGIMICLTLASCGFNYHYFLQQGEYVNEEK